MCNPFTSLERAAAHPPLTRLDAPLSPGKYGVHTTDSTWSLITGHVSVMQALYASAPTEQCAA